MKISLPIGKIFKPSSLALLAVSASICAWLFPDFGVLNKGFEQSAQLDPTSIEILTLWYLLILISFWVGQQLACFLTKLRGECQPVREVVSLESNALYLAFTLIGSLGLGTMLWIILHSMTPIQALLFISLGQTNALKDSIYLDYHIGLVSLRYAVIYPGAIALYRMIRLKSFSALNVFNVLLLFLASFLSSRLMLIAAIVTTCFIVTSDKTFVKVRLWKIVATGLCLFLLLGVLNLSRNAAYYERNRLSFGLAGLNEIIAYLGTPFQVALSTANRTGDLAAQGLGDPTNQSEPYRRYVDIAVNYNTNSAFVALHEQMGYWSWPYVASLCCLMGGIFTFLRSLGRTAFLLPCGTILYSASEVWRLDLFQQGTFVVWFVVGIGLPAAFLFASSTWRFAKEIYATIPCTDPGGVSVPDGTGGE